MNKEKVTRLQLIAALNGKQIQTSPGGERFAVLRGVFYLNDGDYYLADPEMFPTSVLQEMVETGVYHRSQEDIEILGLLGYETGYSCPKCHKAEVFENEHGAKWCGAQLCDWQDTTFKNIIENPETKELFLQGPDGLLYDFNNFSSPAPDTSTWRVVSRATSVSAWVEDPYKHQTRYGVVSVTMNDHRGRLDTFDIGETIQWINAWIEDAKDIARENGGPFSCIWIGAYSDRNVARSKGCFA